MELDKEDLIKLKQEVVEHLKQIDVPSYRLEDTDKRLVVYAQELIYNPDKHNLYELLALKRFFIFIDKYLFKPNEVKKFIVFYEQLKFSGLKRRQRYKLTPVQVFQFTNIMGFYKDEGKRLCREALLFVPRKFSKTTSVSSLAIYDLLFGDANAQCFVAANSYDQAQICFGEIKEILKSLDPKLRHFKINREQIFNLRRGKTSFARCLASSPDKLDGLNASTVIVDEYAQADSAELKNVLTSSMGARVNPLTIVITTASAKLNGPFVELLAAYKYILRDELDNDSVFAHIFEPDIDDQEDNPATWTKVQPHLGVTVQPDFYENEYQKALLTSKDMMTFRTKLLNIFVQDKTIAWLTQDEVSNLAKSIQLNEIEGRPDAMVSVDLSVCDDFSAVSYTIYKKENQKFFAYTDYYIPESLLTTHTNRNLYQRWVDNGHMKLCKGEVIDYKMIAQDILANAKYVRILQIGYDSYKSQEFVNMISALGGKPYLKAVSQTYGTFTSPVESMEYAVKTERINFSNNPITWYCFGNAVIDEDRMENRKPIKRAKDDKIDGVITNLMNLYLFNNYIR